MEADAEKLRLENIARNGLDARIPGLRTRAIDVKGGYVLLIRVPRSFLLPHRVNYKGGNRFWARSSAGKYEPNVQELRTLFTEAPQLLQRVREFREARLAEIRMGHLPVTLTDGTVLVVHLVPLSAFDLVRELSLVNVEKKSMQFAPLGRSTPTNWEINFDGYLGLSNADPEKPHASYVQVFRSGAVEGVSSIEAPYETDRYIHAASIETFCVGSTVRWARALSECGVEPPYVVLASLLGTTGRIMASGGREVSASKVINSPELHFAEVMVNTLALDSPEQAKLLRKPLIEQVWNTIGLISPPTFTSDGDWKLASRNW